MFLLVIYDCTTLTKAILGLRDCGHANLKKNRMSDIEQLGPAVWLECFQMIDSGFWRNATRPCPIPSRISPLRG